MFIDLALSDMGCGSINRLGCGVRRAHRWAAVGLLLASSVLLAAREAAAQSVDQFGVQARADAAERMIVLAVQQGISSLPPTSGQSLTYVFDEADLTYVVSERLGPTSFRSPQLMGPGRLSLRVAASYFDLGETFQPIDYAVSGEGGCAPALGSQRVRPSGCSTSQRRMGSSTASN